MERNFQVLFFVVFILSSVKQNLCASYNDTNVLLHNILEKYNRNVRPVENQSDSVNVNVTLYVSSIQELDEVHGIFSVIGLLSMTWHDENMMWNPNMYGGLAYVLTSYEDVWVPELILTNSVDGINSLGEKWQRVYFYHSGFASWWPCQILKSKCAFEFYNYPFDVQECILTFVVWGYYAGHVNITPATEQVNLSYYTKNPTWKLASLKVNALSKGTQLNFHFILERKAGYVIVNIVLPLSLLNLLNAFVFLLLPDSGERVSYSITVLLSVAVFMTIVSDTLPKCSDPVPLISYKLMLDMMISSLITLVNILNIRLNGRNDKENIPNWLQTLYLFLSRDYQKPKIHVDKGNVKGTETNKNLSKAADRNTSVNPEIRIQQKDSRLMSDGNNSGIQPFTATTLEGTSNENVKKLLRSMLPELKEDGEVEIPVSWQNTTCMLDGIAFVLFTILSVCSLVIFLIITFNY